MTGDPSSADLRARLMARIDAARGQIWTPSDFADLGARPAIDKALQRLVAADRLRRVDRGLYHRPSATPDSTPPVTHYAIIEAVTRRDQARFVVDGMTAANDLGLTQVRPTRIQVLVDARLKPIQLEDQQIVFRAVAPRRLFWAGRPGMPVVQALHWLQDELHNSGDRERVRGALRRHFANPDCGAMIRADLTRGLPALPVWMQEFLRDLLSSDCRASGHP